MLHNNSSCAIVKMFFELSLTYDLHIIIKKTNPFSILWGHENVNIAFLNDYEHF